MRLTLLMILTLLISSCRGNQKKFQENNSVVISDTIPKAKFQLLNFMAEGKPSIALINSEYESFDSKSKYPLSVFITVKSIDKTKEGHPTAKEVIEFNHIESEILRKISEMSLCYVGNTTMNGYRDIIFYLNPSDKNTFDSIIKEIKNNNLRVTDYTFEIDPEWEAVSEFYEALK